MIRVTGNPKNGAIVTAVDAGPIASFGEIDHDEIPGVNSTVIARYYPFEANDPFDSRKLDLAQVRTSLSSIVFSNSFLLGCEETRQAKIRHHLIVGGPNLVRFAVGANTEFGPIARAEWGNSRVGNNASQFNISGRISLRDQKLVTWANVYFDPHTRWHLAPEFGLQRFDEERNASFQITNHVGAKGSMDRGDFRYTLFIGPGTTFIQRLKGVGLDQSFTSSLNVSLEALSHPLELGRANPTQGTLLLFQNKNSLDGLLSSVNAFTFDLSGIHFLNLLDLEPPLVVLSFRFRATTTLTDQNHNSPLSLPLNYRNYLGGAKDIRGFGRNEIPASPAGALTLLTWGTEARVDIPGISQLYLLGFWDFGYLGTQMSSLDRTLYTSPGFGLYWVSPIGVLKGTLAHGVVFHDTPETQVPTHWQFYVSFGGDI
ncbi:MAG: BamA/TamA family outer membrane protein [Bacteriovoracia bacterium]